MTIHNCEAYLEVPYTYKLQLETRARDNVADTRDYGPAEGYFIEECAIVETTRFGLRSANMHIPGMHYCSEMEANQSFNYCDIHQIILTIECRDANIHNGGLAIPSTIPTTIQQIKSGNCMGEITIPNTMPNFLRSYITENTILNEIPTQARRSRATHQQ